MNILYEDNHLLVVEKPVNMPVQADLSGDPDLLSALKAYVKERYQKPGEVYLGLVHRLDRPVGGVMVFARTSKAAARLTEQFQNHSAGKRYAAVVQVGKRAPLPEETLTDWLKKDEATFSSAVVPAGAEGGKEARLSYALLGKTDGAALLDVRLDTGRPHQIRVQLAHAGFPILNDQRYNPSAVPGGQIALWAYALTLTHPTLKEPMTFTCPPPVENGAFGQFPAQVALLPAFAACRGVYVDDELVAVDKNAGVETETELAGQLVSLFGEIYPVHRLDANTEGVIVFARTERARDRLEQRFRAHDLRKVYRAVVCGVPPASGRLVHWVTKDAEAASVRVCGEAAPGALRCELAYTRLAEAGDRSLVEIELLTGRTHQIRVQFAAVGHPVLGDDKYGDRAQNRAAKCRTQALLSKRIELEGHVFESCRALPFFPAD